MKAFIIGLLIMVFTQFFYSKSFYVNQRLMSTKKKLKTVQSLDSAYKQTLKQAVFEKKFKTVDDFRAWYDKAYGETVLVPGGLFSTWNAYSLKQIGFSTRKKSMHCYLFDKESFFRGFISRALEQMDAHYLRKLPASLRNKPMEVYGNVVCIIGAPLKIDVRDAELELGRIIKADDIREMSRRLQSGLDPNTVCAYNDTYQGILHCSLLEMALRVNKNSKKVPVSPMMELLLTNGYDINRVFPQLKLTPLTWAIDARNLSMVKAFVARGADVNQSDGHSLAPLAKAVLNNQLKIAEFLLDKGADPNKTNKIGDVPIFWAKWKMLKLLLKHGARLDVKDHAGHSLMDKALRGDTQLLKLLLRNGYKISRKAAEEQHALHGFASTGDLGMVKYCVETLHLDVNEFVNLGNSLYEAAIGKKNNSAVMEYLISQGARINDNDPRLEKTILTMMAWDGRLSNAVILIKHGAVINDRGREIPECLRWALENRRSRLPMMKLLIDNGAIYHDKHTTIMHLAAVYKDLKAFKYTVALMKNQIDLQNGDGDTPLRVATSWENLKILRYLIKVGANPYLTNKNGGTAFDYAPPGSEVRKILTGTK